MNIGIAGSGQLAQMLVDAAPLLGDDVQAARQSPPQFSYDPEKNFSSLDVVTFENEWINLPTYRALATQHPHVRIAPSLGAVERLRDKLAQKKMLAELKIPSAPYQVVTEKEPTPFGADVVLKWAQFGYDGKGTAIAPDAERSRAFIAEGRARGAEVYAEKKIPFVRELAILGVRGGSPSEIQTWPLVISEQVSGICRMVRSPAIAFGVSPLLDSFARKTVTRILEHLDYVGVLAIEFFETPEGELWVNELAPRVHNSGHATLSDPKNHVSQFENHLRAITRLPLRAVTTPPVSVMLNLVAPVGTRTQPAATPESSPHLKWYGKGELRAGRKMGHLTGWARTVNEAESLLEKFYEIEKNWIQSFTR